MRRIYYVVNVCKSIVYAHNIPQQSKGIRRHFSLNPPFKKVRLVSPN